MEKTIESQIVLVWAKYDKQTVSSHPLICHLIDSGNIFHYLWEKVLPSPTKQLFCHLFDRDPQETKRLVHLLVSLHDIGKASSAFQSLVPELRAKLENIGFPFPQKGLYSPQRHDLISAWWVQDSFLEMNISKKQDIDDIASVLGAHHGFFYSSSDLHSPHRITNLGSAEWIEFRYQIYKMLVDLIKPPSNFTLQENFPQKQTALVLLSGMVVVSDWLASDEKLFPYFIQNTISIAEYDQVSKKNALAALQKTGWLAWNTAEDTRNFTHYSGLKKQHLFSKKLLKLGRS